MPQLRLPRIQFCSEGNCRQRGISRDGKCMVHTSAPLAQRWALNDVHGIKNPIGMELECIVEDDNVRRITDCVTGDGSLPVYGREIKIVADASKIGVKAGDIARKAKMLGGKVTRQCGFHVHTSLPTGRSRDSVINQDRGQALEKIRSICTAMQTEAFSLFPQRLDSNYCRFLRPGSYDDSLLSHYSWVSFSSHIPTIEVRLHSGTLSPSKIYAWGKVCIGLQTLFHDVINGKETEAMKRAANGEFIKIFRKNSVARHYLEARKNAGGRRVRYNMQFV